MTTLDDAIAAGDGTLHGAIDYWQERALKAEAERDAALADAAMRGNVMGRIAIALFGDANNVDDETCVAEVKRWLAIVRAAQALSDEGQEYAFDDIGLGRGAPNSYWEDLDEALDPDDAAIDAALAGEEKA
jgi:hypothetical protein